MVDSPGADEEEVLVLKEHAGSFDRRRSVGSKTDAPMERLPGDRLVRRMGLVFLAFVISRVLLECVGLLAVLIVPPGPGFAGRAGAAAVDVWETWDAATLLDFATTGTVGGALQLGQGEWNFNPLFALLARLAGWITGDAHWGGLIVANLAFIGALFMLRGYVRRVHGADLADRAVVVAAILPGSFVLSGYHPDGLFLLLATASLYAMERAWWLEAAVMIGLGSAASGVGLVLVPVFAVRWFQTNGWGGLAPRAVLAMVVLLAVGLSGRLITMAYLDALGGDPLAAFRALPAWLGQFHDPVQVIATPLVRLARGGAAAWTGSPAGLAADATGAVAILGALAILLAFLRRITIGEAILALGCLLLPLAEGFALSPRLLLAAVPLYPALAALMPTATGAGLVAGGLGLLNGLAMVAFATGSELYR